MRDIKKEMDSIANQKSYTMLCVCVCVVVGVVCAVMVCNWAGSFVESHTEQTEASYAIMWCEVCDGYVETVGGVGDAKGCGVCDRILKW